jgi:hypothetical protein
MNKNLFQLLNNMILLSFTATIGFWSLGVGSYNQGIELGFDILIPIKISFFLMVGFIFTWMIFCIISSPNLKQTNGEMK